MIIKHFQISCSMFVSLNKVRNNTQKFNRYVLLCIFITLSIIFHIFYYGVGCILDLEVRMPLKHLAHYCKLIVKSDTSFIIIAHINQEISLFMFLENAAAAILKKKCPMYKLSRHFEKKYIELFFSSNRSIQSNPSRN